MELGIWDTILLIILDKINSVPIIQIQNMESVLKSVREMIYLVELAMLKKHYVY